MNTNCISEFNFDLCSATELGKLSKCGEIYLSVSKCLILNCLHCNKNFNALNFFYDHVIEYLQDNKDINTSIDEDSKINVQPSDILLHTFPEKKENQEKIEKFEVVETIKEELVISDEFSNDSCNYLNKKQSNLENYANGEEKKFYNFKKNICFSFDDLKTHETSTTEDKDLPKETPKGCWKCDICQTITKRGIERRMHEKTHKGLKKLICETCGKGYTTKKRLSDHIRTHTGEKPFKCRFCPKSFHYESLLIAHDRTHIGSKTYKCDYCDRSFAKKYNKQVHEKIHQSNLEKTSKADFVCTLCNKTYASDYYLALHIKRHEKKLQDSTQKPFECSFCPGTFISNANRSAHERLIHKGEYNYKCDYCGRGFLKLNKKRKHEETHTRVENMYKCDLCECEYAWKQGLLKHKNQKHSSNSPYVCQKCGSKYQSISLFKEHCREHNNEEKRFSCNFCEDRFDTQIKLNKHLIRVHKK